MKIFLTFAFLLLFSCISIKHIDSVSVVGCYESVSLDVVDTIELKADGTFTWKRVYYGIPTDDGLGWETEFAQGTWTKKGNDVFVRYSEGETDRFRVKMVQDELALLDLSSEWLFSRSDRTISVSRE